MWQGAFVPVITPFTDALEVDHAALRALVAWQIEQGAEGIVVCGATGEAPTLSDEEQFAILSTALEVAAGSVPVIAGTGSNDTRKALQRTAKAAEMGAAGALVVLPYYNRPTAEGCFLHFKEVAKAGLPLILYHSPGRTGVRLTAEEIARIAELPEVVAIKESTGELEFARSVIALTRKGIFSSDDPLTLPLVAAGGVGAISIASNLMPGRIKELISLSASGQIAAAEAVEQRLTPLFDALVMESNPQCVKYALSLMGFCRPQLRLPLIEPSPSVKAAIRTALSQVEFLAVK